MSWKGFQKAMSRLPHQMMSKKTDVTKDADFIQLEKRFNETSKVADMLRAEGQLFRDKVSALLTHQSEMASFLSIIYSSQLGVEVEEGGVQRRVQTTPATALQAANDAEAAMAYCRDEVLPELDSIDHYIIRPALELQEIIKQIQKTIVKRNHKLIDYDRHRVSLNKLTSKAERSMNDEKSIFRVQSQLDTATQDYEYLNNMLKSQLPIFLNLQFEFIQPIFEHIFHLQAKIFGMIYARCYELITANEQHFVTQGMSVEAGYQWRKEQYDVQAEIQDLDLLKSGGKAWLSASGAANSSKLTLQERASLKNNGSPPPKQIGYQPQHSPQQQQIYPSAQPSYQSTHEEKSAYHEPQYEQPAPAYVHAPAPSYNQAPSYGHQQQHSSYHQPAPAAGGLVSPRTAPTPPPSRAKYVLALYDYDAQAEGDLSFKKDDKIELINRTEDANDWWTGKLRGVIGVFPGNYVQEV